MGKGISLANAFLRSVPIRPSTVPVKTWAPITATRSVLKGLGYALHIGTIPVGRGVVRRVDQVRGLELADASIIAIVR